MLPVNSGYTNSRTRTGMAMAVNSVNSLDDIGNGSGGNGCSAMLRGRRHPRTPTEVYVVGDVGKDDAHIVRVVHISDTLDRHQSLLSHIPDGDVLVHSGNLTVCSRRRHISLSGMSSSKQERDLSTQVDAINSFFGKMPHRYKIFVPGSNETSLEQFTREQVQIVLKDVIYLRDSGCVIDGLRFWGTPWSTQKRGKTSTGSCSSAKAFCKPNFEAIQSYWDNIPDSTEVLITHTPPEECPELLEQVLCRIKPRLSLFGHSSNTRKIKWKENILFCNGAACLVEDSWYSSRSSHNNHVQQRSSTPIPIVVDFYIDTKLRETRLPAMAYCSRSRHTSSGSSDSRHKVGGVPYQQQQVVPENHKRRKCVVS